ncbi:BON domain-containing protein [Simplicispira hankyongi]|jgi:osmotically-inducible protein OsmY|uniref:BON domain-containing protein n=1 Tax=Simplicispira hankyongi TaxID=2315688 RepID=A0A398C971_9BURK|nr:BON domain-containing protein [Simplicispira hankyongi]MBU6466390.1 BON domain-containing protein [Burkholderiales bacterium]RID97368.1 BON domain-containing protein [Simplicispira hankyongi]
MKFVYPTRLLVSLLAAATLAGCAAPLILGGAAVGGMVAIDRRTTGTQVEDEGIELRATNQIFGDYGDKVHINVTSFNRQVLLTGEVPTQEVRDAVAQRVAKVANVRSIVNELAVMPSTPLTQRSNDTFITGKMRASLVDAKDLTASAFKVVTERGVIYLMGIVSQREAKRATAIARGVTGVRKVVRVFEYVSDDDLARMNAPARAPVTDTNSGTAPAK